MNGGEQERADGVRRATILIVEDEAPLRGLLSRYLERQGYTVIACGDGAEGLERFNSETAGIDLAIVDLTLPDMSGERVAETLLEASPTVRVIISSGRLYSTEAVPQPQRHRVEALLKPYLPQTLLDTIAEMLDSGGQASIS